MSRQHCCRCVCETSTRYIDLKYRSRDFEISWNFTARHIYHRILDRGPQCGHAWSSSGAQSGIFRYKTKLTHWPLASVKKCLQKWSSNANFGQVYQMIFLCIWKPMFPSQQWSGLWLGAVRQQTITWTIVDQDPCRHMASLGVNELISWLLMPWLLVSTNRIPQPYQGSFCVCAQPMRDDVIM